MDGFGPQENVNIFAYYNEDGNLELPPEFILVLLGGEWPKSEDYGYSKGFDWDAADSYVIFEGQLIPHLAGAPMDGPNLQLDAVPNPLSRARSNNTDL